MTTKILPGACALLLTSVAACYVAAPPTGEQRCGADNACPDGMRCVRQIDPTLGAAGYCWSIGDTPECRHPRCGGSTPRCLLDGEAAVRCVQCLTSSDCDAGFVCMGGACARGCSAARPECGSDAGSCDVDLGACRGCRDDSECGGATPRCDVSSGLCLPCNPMNDNCPANQYCGGASGRFACTAGCKVDAECAGPGVAKGACCDHRCVDLAGSAMHCGACGTSCTNGQACCGGRCSDVATDPMNCGACGAACAEQNVVAQRCQAGRCQGFTCADGWGDCDLDTPNGCESNLRSDPSHCGSCPMACAAQANSTPLCVNALCSQRCSAGFADCNGAMNDGCEVNVASDPANCGRCGNGCAAPPNARAACAGSLCNPPGRLACNAGFGDCDNQVGNGCEVNVQTDPANCGACGAACGNGRSCVAGKCI